jgi:hypothetical protein
MSAIPVATCLLVLVTVLLISVSGSDPHRPAYHFLPPTVPARATAMWPPEVRDLVAQPTQRESIVTDILNSGIS